MKNSKNSNNAPGYGSTSYLSPYMSAEDAVEKIAVMARTGAYIKSDIMICLKAIKNDLQHQQKRKRKIHRKKTKFGLFIDRLIWKKT